MTANATQVSPAQPAFEGDPLLLTEAELADLTGYRRAANQCQWLKTNRIPFYRQRLTGKPRVVRAALTGPSARAAEQEGPNLDWLKQTKA